MQKAKPSSDWGEDTHTQRRREWQNGAIVKTLGYSNECFLLPLTLFSPPVVDVLAVGARSHALAACLLTFSFNFTSWVLNFLSRAENSSLETETSYYKKWLYSKRYAESVTVCVCVKIVSSLRLTSSKIDDHAYKKLINESIFPPFFFSSSKTAVENTHCQSKM